MLDIERIYVGMSGWARSCPPSPCGAAVNPYMITMKNMIKAKIEIINIHFLVFIVSVLGLTTSGYKLFPFNSALEAMIRVTVSNLLQK